LGAARSAEAGRGDGFRRSEQPRIGVAAYLGCRDVRAK
jgi:hypothetical protein